VARILVIDDSSSNRELAVYLLHHRGHTVEVAGSGPDGVRAALADPPDLILLDLWMPGVDGYATARMLRAEASLRAIPMVAVSSTSDRLTRRMRRSGLDAYIPLPMHAETFARQVEAHLPAASRAESGPPA
jgi:CheY-like chemotaxis protein